MFSARHCVRRSLRIAAQLHSRHELPTFCALRRLKTSSSSSNEALASPSLDNVPKEYSPKIHQLVNDIASLTLLEVSDLNELLKKTLNIKDMGMMPMGAMPVALPSSQAKKLVESLPQEIKANVSKDEAGKLKAVLEAAGGTVVLE